MRIDTRLRARISIGGVGDNTIIGTPGLDNNIEIDHLNFIVTSADSTVTLKDGTSTIADYPLVQNSSFVFDNVNPSLNAFALGNGSSFIINLSGGEASIKGFILYRKTV